MKRKYLVIGNFTKPRFIAKARKIIGNLRRDINELKLVNITDQEITDAETKVENAAQQMNETSTVSNRKDAVKSKSQRRAELMTAILQTIAILKHYYGATDVTEYDHIKGASGMTDTELEVATGDFIQTLQANADVQKKGGITTAVLNQLIDARQNFADAIKNINEINADRSVQTDTRNATFGEAYAEIVLLADIAKTYWKSQNDNRYSDYVLMPRSKSSASPPAPTPSPATNTATNNVAVAAETPTATNNTVA